MTRSFENEHPRRTRFSNASLKVKRIIEVLENVGPTTGGYLVSVNKIFFCGWLVTHLARLAGNRRWEVQAILFSTTLFFALLMPNDLALAASGHGRAFMFFACWLGVFFWPAALAKFLVAESGNQSRVMMALYLGEVLFFIGNLALR